MRAQPLPRYLQFVCLIILIPFSLSSQPEVEFLGLSDLPITSLGIYGSVTAVGTNGEGVYYQYSDQLPDSGWLNIGLEGKNISAVYPHKSGALGWAITAGLFPEGEDSVFVYCSYLGEDFVPNNDGISKENTRGIYDLAGFPDPTICGEKYAAAGPVLYVQHWPDSVWTVSWSGSCIGGGCTIVTVETSEEWYGGGFVIAGGGIPFYGTPLLFKSTDYGQTWEAIHSGLTRSVRSLDFSVNLSATDEPYIDKIFVSENSRVFRSIDGGETWELSYEDGWNWFSEVVYDPLSEIVFIAGGDGLDTSSSVLLFSENWGETWSQVPLSMSGPIVGLDVASDGYVYFSAPYSGVYRILLSELSTADKPVQLPTDFFLSQPFPNPFNPSTTIEFSVPQAGLVTLTVYDLVGREAETILSKPVTAGHHKVRWNASIIPSGIYILRMQAEGYSQTRKLTVLR